MWAREGEYEWRHVYASLAPLSYGQHVTFTNNKDNEKYTGERLALGAAHHCLLYSSDSYCCPCGFGFDLKAPRRVPLLLHFLCVVFFFLASSFLFLFYALRINYQRSTMATPYQRTTSREWSGVALSHYAQPLLEQFAWQRRNWKFIAKNKNRNRKLFLLLYLCSNWLLKRVLRKRQIKIANAKYANSTRAARTKLGKYWSSYKCSCQIRKEAPQRVMANSQKKVSLEQSWVAWHTCQMLFCLLWGWTEKLPAWLWYKHFNNFSIIYFSTKSSKSMHLITLKKWLAQDTRACWKYLVSKACTSMY